MHMDYIAKSSAPIPLIILVLLIPIANLAFGIVMYSFTDENNTSVIDKIFNIKN